MQERISEALKLSPALAGVTLLSFGNGAPDVFTQLSMASGVRSEERHLKGGRETGNIT